MNGSDSYYENRLYNSVGNLILKANNGMFSLNYDCDYDKLCPDFELFASNKKYIKADSYYYAENGVINKYDLNGKKVSSSKKYYQIYQVGSDYSFVYINKDDSIYVVKNDETYSKKISQKESSDYSMSINYTDSINNHIKNIEIYDGYLGIQYHAPHNKYVLNVETGEITINNAY